MNIPSMVLLAKQNNSAKNGALPATIVSSSPDAMIHCAFNAPEVRERLEATGAIPVGNAAEEIAQQIKASVDIYVKVARNANIRAE